MHDDIQDLLDFGTTNVFYVVWRKHGHIFYLLDCSEDYRLVKWTKTREYAIYFYTEKEAVNIARLIRTSGRESVSVSISEINVLDRVEDEYTI